MARLSVINLTPEQTQELLDGPAGTPPAGVSPNFENPPNLHVVLILTLTLALVFGTLAVIMRTHTKLLIIRSFVYEDCKFSPYFSIGCHSHLLDAILIGWVRPEEEVVYLDFGLLSQGTRHCRRPSRWDRSSACLRAPHLGPPIEGIYQDALCMSPCNICQILKERLIIVVVEKRCFNYLLPYHVSD